MPFGLGRRDEEAAPAPARPDPAQAVFQGLSAARARIAGRVPMEVLCEVGLIIELVGPLLAESGMAGADRLASSSDAVDILRRISTDYLPSALDAYLKLPRDYADAEPLNDGRTAKEGLLAQLAILRDRVEEASEAARRGDTDALLASQRFLESRFGASDALTLHL